MAIAQQVKLKDREFASMRECRQACETTLKQQKILSQARFDIRLKKYCRLKKGIYVSDYNLRNFAALFASDLQSEDAFFYKFTFKSKKGDAIYVGITSQPIFARIQQHIDNSFNNRSSSKFSRYLKRYFDNAKPTLDLFNSCVVIECSKLMPAHEAILKEDVELQHIKSQAKEGLITVLNTGAAGSLHGRVGKLLESGSTFSQIVNNAVIHMHCDEHKKQKVLGQIRAAYYRRLKEAMRKKENWDAEANLNQVIAEIKNRGKVIPSNSDTFLFDDERLSIVEIMQKTSFSKAKIKSLLTSRNIKSGSSIDVKNVLANPSSVQRKATKRRHSFLDFLTCLKEKSLNTTDEQTFHAMSQYQSQFKPTKKYPEPSFGGFATFLQKSTIKTAFNHHASKDLQTGLTLFLNYMKAKNIILKKGVMDGIS